ncbi:type I glutamate--ammonia ligase [Tautonia sociabilis]|uniref:Glutamine synthetase n=1 Tax=Tautonia sociabilis TaxID=2080755 RepID=A0A432MJR9_9BACT|nr:type I glutamate--ammonia ligase [Tautonia sociabilis]RUL87447.1 type I glutamate--ammonia ligase [Tautonia sociabilis]
MATTPADVQKLAKDAGVQIVDLRFIDLPGVWQHFSIPVRNLTDDLFEDGLGFDGSSVRGYQQIQESDMLLKPDPETAKLDPFMAVPTLSLICNVFDPVTLEPYSRDPRYIATKAEAYLKSTGIADTSYWGPEAEFFVFDDVRYEQTASTGFYKVDSKEAIWNSARDEGPNLGYKIRHKEGYFPVPPADSLQDIRSEMILEMEKLGIPIDLHHHEVGTSGQGEIGMRFDTLRTMADKVLYYKYVIKNVARRHGKTATFMPKPIFGDNGSGMHTHQSLWKDGTNLFYDETKYAGLSDTARYYIGGLLKHAPSLLALTNPTTNSYRRLVPGYEAPVNLVYSQRNRSAAIRIPLYSKSAKGKRIEFRCPDPSCNPYLAFSALMMAGLDGIQNKIDPGEPMDRDLYDLEPEEAVKIKSTPGSLAEVLDNLEKDHAFLLKGDVFTPDVIETWISYKRERELQQVNLRPVPYEFYLYFDI